MGQTLDEIEFSRGPEVILKGVGGIYDDYGEVASGWNDNNELEGNGRKYF